MKAKRILTTIALLLVVFLAVSFFLPKDMNTAVTKQLEASPEQVFAQVNNLKNWRNWNPWDKMDPEMQFTYGESYSGEGGSYTWKSEKKRVGSGAAIITESIPHTRLTTRLLFEGYEDDASYGSFDIAPAGEGSRVTWSFESDYAAKWPWQKFQMTMGKLGLNQSFNAGLTKMDAYIAEHPEAHQPGHGGSGIEIVEKEVESMSGLSVTKSGTFVELEKMGSQLWAEAYGEVGRMIGEQGLVPSGMPFAVNHVWDEANGLFEIEFGIPVESDGNEIGGGKVIMASYYGDYHDIYLAHDAAEAYCAKHGLQIRGASWEVYVTDPAAEPDTSRWLTEVYYPVH
jgi:hypothetical protein